MKRLDLAGCSKQSGRNLVCGDKLLLIHSGSGCEFLFTGKKLTITLGCDKKCFKEGNVKNVPRAAILIDGEFIVKKRIEGREESYTVIDNDTPVTKMVRIVKLSEAAFSIAEVSAECDDEGGIIATPAHSLKMEFIGDSITCGYGVDDSNTASNFSTEAENALKSYATLTAKLLGADYSLFSYSGYGIISGYTDDGKRNTREVLPQWYETYGFSYSLAADGSKTQDIPWDFSKFMPDIVVLNLGTNDNSYCRMNEGGYEEFEEKYLEFLRTIRRCNPQAHIVCVMGMMETGVDTYIRNAAKRSGDERCTCVSLTTQNGWLGYGSNWHPSEDTHAYRAKELAEYITQAMENGTISISK
ncbi:MAG: lipase [Ruminococcus sp.]|nr:lipase [Ruminococcus sp.]